MLCEKHAIPGKTINIWRTEFLLTKAAQVTITKVVSDEIDNVGKGILRFLLLTPRQNSKH
jgi:hypothetical protein